MSMNERDTQTARAGDHVLHRPSGEIWIVSRVKIDTGRLSPFGWPPSEALISDCAIVKRCSDDEHDAAVKNRERIGR